MAIEKIIVEEKISNKELGKKRGWFFNDKDYTLINKDCNVFDKDGKLVCKVRKGAMKTDIIDNFNNVFFPINSKRGMNAGEIDTDKLDELYGKNKYTLVDKFRWLRVNKGDTKSKFRLNNPVRSNIVGYFDAVNSKTKEKHIKITRNTNERSLKSLEKITKRADELYKELLPQTYNHIKDDLNKLNFKEFLYRDCLSTTITINTDFRTGLHQDSNNYNKIGMMAVLNDGEEHFKGGELLFPRWNLKVKLEAGDFILFDSDTYHTNNKIIGGKRYSFVFYLRKDIVGFYTKDSKINRGYTENLFIDYDKPAILLIDKYHQHKEKINEYAVKNNLLIYRLSKKSYINSRKFGKRTFRYVNKNTEKLFKKPIYINNIK